MGSFNENIALLTKHILRLDPDYSNFQVDPYQNENNYIFSLQGLATLNTANRELYKFMISIRIKINVADGKLLRNDAVKIEDIIAVDFIKIKIFI